MSQKYRRNGVKRTSRCRVLLVLHLSVLMLMPPVLFSGCAASKDQWRKTLHNDTCEIDHITRRLDNPAPEVHSEVSMTREPVTAITLTEAELQYSDMSLGQVLCLAMEHSTVLRDIGGVVLRSPDTAKTGFATRLQETDPRFGMEAALSAFDAQLAASANFNKNNRIYNNSFFAGGATAFSQDLHDYQVQLSKRTATGSLLAIRGVTDYDANNAPANTFPSAWDAWLEGEVRQPLLQGGGLEFNRIAGPGAQPGLYNGVLIAKANTDINHAEFMTSLRDFVSNVENTYWDLYGAYRELDARKKAMERALVAWNEAKTKAKNNASSFGLADEALARQQYYQLKASVDEALSGRLLQGTHTQNGSGGGTLQMSGGVLAAERRLRLMIGLPAADGQLIRTIDEPTMAQIYFDWNACMDEAIQQRPELQRQNATVRKREMELLAARNFLNPRLDAIGRYRWRGFGNDLIADGNNGGTAPASAIGNLVTGDQQEWTLGVELTVPIGYRKAHAAVQNAELGLVRARAIQKEQQREVVSNLNGAIADAVRAYQSVENNLNQYLAARDYMAQLDARREGDRSDGADRILDAQRRLVEAEIQFFRARAEYAVALKNVHYEKGSLLRYKDLRVQGEPEYDTRISPSPGVLIQEGPTSIAPPAEEEGDASPTPPAVPDVQEEAAPAPPTAQLETFQAATTPETDRAAEAGFATFNTFSAADDTTPPAAAPHPVAATVTKPSSGRDTLSQTSQPASSATVQLPASEPADSFIDQPSVGASSPITVSPQPEPPSSVVTGPSVSRRIPVTAVSVSSDSTAFASPVKTEAATETPGDRPSPVMSLAPLADIADDFGARPDHPATIPPVSKTALPSHQSPEFPSVPQSVKAPKAVGAADSVNATSPVRHLGTVAPLAEPDSGTDVRAATKAPAASVQTGPVSKKPQQSRKTTSAQQAIPVSGRSDVRAPKFTTGPVTPLSATVGDTSPISPTTDGPASAISP